MENLIYAAPAAWLIFLLAVIGLTVVFAQFKDETILDDAERELRKIAGKDE